MDLQQENGSKQINSKAITGLTIHKTLKAQLPPKLDDTSSDQLHFTEDGGIYLSRSDGTFQQMGGSGGASGDYLTKNEYKGSADGIVKKADVSIEVEGVKSAQPLMYYGTDNQGKIGFHYVPIDNATQDGGIEQRVILNVTNGQVVEIGSKNSLDEAKCLIQAYKFLQGSKDVISTIKEFNNANKESFHYDENNVVFENGSRIKDMYSYAMSKHNTTQFFETETMNKADFLEIKGILIG